ncbi:hypothetical protein [Promicromonospora soli]|uniref:Uncharacterized protein n=1 Tax=Promicromonospora soli TaxID=2035533 RepID=A0A919KTG7_9MICO|nr:hypothetical protein [Promicromonospora soli]GHH71833.1 hypothetical protein GCM10017772_20390 [Promicromonospora soli]
MAQLDWLHVGVRSDKPIVTAPGVTDTGAVTQVDDALDGFSGKVPGWFKALEKIGYWWYAICVIAGLAFSLALSPAEMAWKIAAGLTIGLVAAPVTSGLLRLLAKAQARAGGESGTERALAVLADRARPVSGETKFEVEAVLAKDPSLEHRVHQLAWRATEDPAARKELESLWEMADPAAAAARAAKFAELDAKIASLKQNQGKK